ncbi:MAG: N-acetyl sugar amidotransferase [Proteobacteria bacterium]|nr:N-acetyl sugar amidotransferase [Pseudomonadota bacterium]
MKLQTCARCVMDTSDPDIVFDKDGVCNHCREFDEVTKKRWFPNEEGGQKLKQTIECIKKARRGQPYDCIIGLSGGVDSSYLALKVKDWGLRPLVVHVDAGWNSELAVANIEAIVKHCNYHLHTHVVDWEEMRGLQLAYLKAAVANQDVPQDHVFFASLYHFAIKNGIKYILSGGNIATESIAPKAWQGSAMDAANLRAIHRIYGKGRLRTYSTISFPQYYFWYPFVRGLRTVRPLNYMHYDKAKAIEEMESAIGWRSYGRKHGESVFTKFFQNFYLPTKFGYDKRRPHLSSLIVSGQMKREDALVKLEEPLYVLDELETEIIYFCKKMRISREEFDGFMAAPIHHYSDFQNWDRWHRLLKKGQSFFERMTGRRKNIYS